MAKTEFKRVKKDRKQGGPEGGGYRLMLKCPALPMEF